MASERQNHPRRDNLLRLCSGEHLLLAGNTAAKGGWPVNCVKGDLPTASVVGKAKQRGRSLFRALRQDEHDVPLPIYMQHRQMVLEVPVGTYSQGA